MLLGRPHEPGIETVNDKDAYIANFWRALTFAPEETAKWADWPVNETDLEARHRWLVSTGAERIQLLQTDPEYFDAQVAGWWVWGLCSWIGGGWCAGRGIHRQLPHLGNAGQGIHRQLPHLGDAGRGINRQLPHLGDAGQGISAYFGALAKRLRKVRVCSGDWSRVTGPSVTFKHGLTGVFLDPPYADTAGRDPNIYAVEDLHVAHAVREWAIANGDNPLLRIALCGYEGEHEMPVSWDCVAWKAQGGFGSQSDGAGRENKHRERIWFSPHCISGRQGNLF